MVAGAPVHRPLTTTVAVTVMVTVAGVTAAAAAGDSGIVILVAPATPPVVIPVPSLTRAVPRVTLTSVAVVVAMVRSFAIS